MIVSGDHDVGRLEIAVDDARLVRGLESADHLPGEVQRAADREPALPAQLGGEILALHVRHRDVLDAIDLAGIVRSDVGPAGRRSPSVAGPKVAPGGRPVVSTETISVATVFRPAGIPHLGQRPLSIPVSNPQEGQTILTLGAKPNYRPGRC